MSNYSSEITAWYEAIQYRAPPASELTRFDAQLKAGIITTAQAVAQIEASTYTQNYVDPVIREYQAAFGRVPDQAGVAYWVGQVAANPANLAVLSTAFANSAEFLTDYGASATTPASSTLVTALYTTSSAARRTPRASPIGPIPASTPRSCCSLSRNRRNSSPTPPPTSSSFRTRNPPATRRPAARFITKRPGPSPRTPTPSPTARRPPLFSPRLLGGVPVTGTIAGGPTGPIGSTEAAGNSNVTINACLGLNNSQSIVFNGINNVLNADYTPGVGPVQSLTISTFPTSNFDQVGLNIQGVQTWNIEAEVPITPALPALPTPSSSRATPRRATSSAASRP